MSERLPRAGLRAVACTALMSAVLWSPPAFARQAGDPAGQSPAPAAPPPIPWYQTVSFNGLVSTSYVANFNAPASRTNQFRVFDSTDRTMALDVVELVVQRTVSQPGDAGFRADLTFGTSVPRVTAALGLFRDASGQAGDFDVQQAFLSYIAPVGRGVRVDAGKFVTHIGYEVIEGYDGFNDNHSRGLLFGYAEPFTHTGLRVSYPFSDRVSAQVLRRQRVGRRQGQQQREVDRRATGGDGVLARGDHGQLPWRARAGGQRLAPAPPRRPRRDDQGRAGAHADGELRLRA